MDKLIPALAVAAASGLTFLAYKHPRPFESVFIVLNGVFILFWAVWFGWDLGVYNSTEAVFDFVAADKIKDAVAAGRSYRIPLWATLSASGVYVYLSFLRFGLPYLLDEDKPIDKKRGQKRAKKVP